MQDIKQFAEQIHNSYKLKFTYRYSDRTFNGEKDSTAAHSWNMMIMADYFLNYLEEVSP